MLCDFAQAFPAFVADILEREVELKRSFREETLTDMWVSSLVPLKKYGVHVDLAIESETGGDLEIWFLSKRLDRALAFIIQAKRIHCRRGSPRPAGCITQSWKTHSFPHLDYHGGKGRPKGSQADDLVNASNNTGRNLYPLYAFYSPQHVCDSSGRLVEGVMLADGFDVRDRIVRGLRDRKRFKQVGALQDLFIPLSAMFCVKSWKSAEDALEKFDFFTKYFLMKFASSGVEILNIPDPEDVRKSMTDAISRKVTTERTNLPTVTENISSDIRRMVSGELPDRRERYLAKTRSRIVFVALSEAG
jgi:hypothetical protein